MFGAPAASRFVCRARIARSTQVACFVGYHYTPPEWSERMACQEGMCSEARNHSRVASFVVCDGVGAGVLAEVRPTDLPRTQSGRCALGNCTFARAAMHTRCPERVKTSRQNMSAAAAAFADSRRGEAALRQAPSDRILFVRLRWCARTDASIDIASASVTPSSDTL
jgi:hypothetical protein